MALKLLKRDRVLTAGRGCERVVLDYDSSIIYKYDDPETVVATFESGRWITPNRPYYRQAGWGNSSGDRIGHETISNAWSLIQSLGGKYVSVNIDSIMDLGQIDTYLKNLAKIKKLKQAARKLGLDPENTQVEERGLKILSGNTDGRGKGMDPFKTLDLQDKAIQVFISGKGKPVKVDTYRITPNLVTQDKTVVAFRDSAGQVFMNSMVLDVSRFEKQFLGAQSNIQSEIRKISKFNIPFNVLASAGLKLNETKVLEQGPESTHTLKDKTERHFTGALLLENNERKFLMDIDRIEITHGLFNAFFVEVNSNVTSIADAYESMKPDEVKQAEKNGVEVKRQGEWFFIKTDKTVTISSEDQVYYYDREVEGQAIVRKSVAHGKGRPNDLYVPTNFGTEFDGLVCGVVTHSGREHADLNLGMVNADGTSCDRPRDLKYVDPKDSNKGYQSKTFQCWKLVPNTTVSNFTITGDVD